MTVLVLGASGATGRLLIEQLLSRGESVKAIVRAGSKLPETISGQKKISVLYASVLDLSDEEIAQYAKGCNAIVSCLGHNLSFNGIYGHPRRLVTEATRRLCKSAKANKPEKTVKFILMNTTGNSNRDISEPTSFRHKGVIFLLRLLLPPQADNEKAADFLRTEIGQNDSEIQWVAVRPDSLIDETEVTDYEEHPSPIRDAIFDAGHTSRINVAHFMAELITNQDKWIKWKGKMPVIYNIEET